jgi:hypothetical protein
MLLAALFRGLSDIFRRSKSPKSIAQASCAILLKLQCAKSWLTRERASWRRRPQSPSMHLRSFALLRDRPQRRSPTTTYEEIASGALHATLAVRRGKSVEPNGRTYYFSLRESATDHPRRLQPMTLSAHGFRRLASTNDAGAPKHWRVPPR